MPQSRLQSSFAHDCQGEKRSLREESSVSTGVENGNAFIRRETENTFRVNSCFSIADIHKENVALKITQAHGDKTRCTIGAPLYQNMRRLEALLLTNKNSRHSISKNVTIPCYHLRKYFSDSSSTERFATKKLRLTKKKK